MFAAVSGLPEAVEHIPAKYWRARHRLRSRKRFNRDTRRIDDPSRVLGKHVCEMVYILPRHSGGAVRPEKIERAPLILDRKV